MQPNGANKLDIKDNESFLVYNKYLSTPNTNLDFMIRDINYPSYSFDEQSGKEFDSIIEPIFFDYKDDYSLHEQFLNSYKIYGDNSNKRMTTSIKPLFKIEKSLKVEKKFEGKKRLREDTNTNESVNDINYNNYNEKLHGKKDEDNIMRKIKAKLFEIIVEKLNDSLKNKEYKFCKLDKKLSEYLKKDYNEKLMQRTIMDIISNTPINNKYKKEKYINKKLIDKILKENKETNTIKILNKKYIDIINEIRYNEENLFIFIEKIKLKEEKINKYDNINIDEYMELVKDLTKRYDQWFFKKFGNKSRQKKIK